MRVLDSAFHVDRVLGICCLLVPIALGKAEEGYRGFPPHTRIEAEGGDWVPFAMVEREGAWVAQSHAKIQIPLPPRSPSIRFVWQAAAADPGNDLSATPSLEPLPEKRTVGSHSAVGVDKPILEVELSWEGGRKEKWQAIPTDGEATGALPDARWHVRFSGGIPLSVYARPNTFYYREDRLAQVKTEWNQLPSASTSPLAVEFRRRDDETELWLAGRLAQTWTETNGWHLLTLRLSPGSFLREWRMEDQEDESATRIVPLDIPSLARPAAGLSNFTLHFQEPSMKSGGERGLRISTSGVYLAVANLGRLSCPVDDLVSFYWRRTAFDGLPESRIVSVPLRPYRRIHLLVAAAENSEQTPAMTVRLTRFANGRGDAMADTLVRLPIAGKEEPQGSDVEMRPAGSVVYFREGQAETATLWRVCAPLKTGFIQDLLLENEQRYGYRGSIPAPRYLDIEFLDPVAGVEEEDRFPPSLKPTGRSYTPSGPPSSLLVFGAALEISSAAMTVRSIPTPSVFYREENPVWAVEVNGCAGRYGVEWRFADFEGRIVREGEETVLVPQGEGRAAIQVSVGELPYDWYAAQFVLRGEGGERLMEHRAGFVVLPPDTRKAGFESPHGAWWFHWAHGGAPDFERVGALYRRAGLRHANLPRVTEAESSRHGLFEWCVYWNGKLTWLPTMDEIVSAYEAHIRAALSNHPSLNTIMIWHESDADGARIPSELWGRPPPLLSDEQAVRWKLRTAKLTALAQMVREKFPGMKLQFGNTGDSCAIVAELLRQGFPTSYVDYVAVEDLGQTFIPERPLPGAMQSAWLLRETARALGCPTARITACYEWIGRGHRPLGLHQQAAWYARDALQARAYGFHAIALGTIHDAGQGYFHTIWGANGLTSRYPYMYPKPAYAAMATLTLLLDGARFSRVIETGTHALFVLEFERREGGWLYTFWTPRGKREVRLEFEKESQCRVISLLGRERLAQRQALLSLEVGEGPVYVETEAPLQKVEAGRSFFPDELPPERLEVGHPLNSLDGLVLMEEPDPRLERTDGWRLPHRTLGQFDLRIVDDVEKGPCLEVALRPGSPLSWDLVHEYAMIRFGNPPLIRGPVRSLGLWVNGNGGWGDVMWEVTNAKGETWLTTGDYWDWPGRLAINFDGWHFLRLELPPKFQTDLRITGVGVTIPRKALAVTEMTSVRSLRLRLKDVGAF